MWPTNGEFMTEGQPQVFTIPAATLQRVVDYLADQPFREVAPLMSMIDGTAKLQENDDATSKRSVRQRSGSKPKQ